MTIQWHPIFAQLLRPLVESQYELPTRVAVGDAPREADIVLLRRTAASTRTLTGLWRWLTAWNVLEYKGPTVSARVDHLDLLVELGLGIHRRLNEEQDQQGQARVDRAEVALWYVAGALGRRWLAAAERLLGPLELLDTGVWRATCLGRPLVLVSGRAVPLARDTLPLHLLQDELEAQLPALARVLGDNVDLLPTYGPWLFSMHPALFREVQAMARTKGKKAAFDFQGMVNVVGWREILRQTGLRSLIDEMGVKSLIDEVGVKPLIDEVGLERLVEQMTPQQRRELAELLQQGKSRKSS